jgi:hypothetical protein
MGRTKADAYLENLLQERATFGCPSNVEKWGRRVRRHSSVAGTARNRSKSSFIVRLALRIRTGPAGAQ